MSINHSRCHSVATIQWQRAVRDGSSQTLPDSCPTRNFDTLPQLNRCVEARKLLVYVPAPALPVGGAQVLLQDDHKGVMSRYFVTPLPSLPLCCHFSLLLRLVISRLCIGVWDPEVRRDARRDEGDGARWWATQDRHDGPARPDR